MESGYAREGLRMTTTGRTDLDSENGDSANGSEAEA
jgi:hypothetical protein